MSESVINLQADCFFAPLTKETIVSASSFSCGNADLDDFFQQDAVLYAEHLWESPIALFLQMHHKRK